MEKKDIIKEAQFFMAEVKKIYKDSPYLLKRCARETSNLSFYKMFPRFAHKIANYGDQSYVYKIIASIYSVNPISYTEHESLGISCKRYQDIKKGAGSFEGKFLRFINSNNREYMFNSGNILRLFKLLNRESIPVNYENLFFDLWIWGERVKDNYACDYYSIGAKTLI